VPLFAIVNTDDAWGKKLRMASNCGLWTYGQDKKADFSFQILTTGFDKTEFFLNSPLGKFHGSFPMCGAHNIYNLVGCVAAAASMGVPVLYSLKTCESFPGVPGRLQSVANSRGVHVFIDYAHTPDGLEKVLQALNEIKSKNKLTGKIITVFGCGGDRDRAKRPVMAAISEKYSDEVIVTSDNPRSEDPFQIIQEINVGFEKMRPIVEVDRKVAIQQAILHARPGDVVLIAGKGHEDYQQIGLQKLPFNDFELAKGMLN
jgi:UDP-N-acetylmuramoyl-L-alanyl-D-glutamate--2,6-diaminopimelate ligase